MDEDLKSKIKETKPDLYKVAFQKGTEAPFTGKYVDEKKPGVYNCGVCGQELFHSDVKMSSHEGPVGLQGWPSFSEALDGSVEYVQDNSMGMNRTEVICSKCKSHLGHIFDDGNSSTRKHYCINSCSLDLKSKE
jgi:peptide-methionine (R)-S-oxide reductase